MGGARVLVLVLVAMWGACGRAVALEPTVVQGSGSGSGGVTTALAQFRSLLGQLNPPAGSSGRREFAWDTLTNSVVAPNSFPGTYLFSASRKGLLFTTPGSGLVVSSNGTDVAHTPLRFAHIKPEYGTTFTTLSRECLFAPLGSTVVDLDFYVAPTNPPAVVRGFGAVFVDVDTAGSAAIEYFNGDTSLGSFSVPAAPDSPGLSFLGVDFGTGVVTRVRITAGTAPLGGDDLSDGGADDLVVLDDIVYGNPVERADLRLTVEATPNPVEIGAELTQSITVVNDGPGAASGVVVHVVLPAGMTFVTGTEGCTADDSAVTCALGSIAAQTSTAVSLVATPHRSGALAVAVEVTSDGDPDLTDDTATLEVTVPGCALEPTYSASTCRIEELFSRVQDAMTATALRARLLAALARAKGKVQAAEAMAAAGQRGPAHRLVKAARGAVASVGRRLKGGRSGLDAATRADLAATAKALAADLRRLAAS